MFEELKNMRINWHQDIGTPCMLISHYIYYWETGEKNKFTRQQANIWHFITGAYIFVNLKLTYGYPCLKKKVPSICTAVYKKYSRFSSDRILRVVLTHWGRETLICASKLTTNGSDDSLSPGWHQAMNQCWKVVNSNLKDELRWSLERNSYIFIHESAIGNIVWKMAAILSRPHVNIINL